MRTQSRSATATTHTVFKMQSFLWTIVFICSSTSTVFGYTGASTGTRSTCSYAESSSPKDSSTATSTSTMSAPNKPISIPWLIVGGGIHGVHIAARLVGSGVCSSTSTHTTPSQDICIVDGHDSLLKSWKSRTRNTGMKYLRSSAGYHLDLLEDSLRFFGNDGDDNHGDGDEFATRTNNDKAGQKRKTTTKKNKRKKKKRLQIHNNNKEGYFSNDYKRPRLDIFNQHCDSVIDKYNLDQMHTQGIVTKIEPLEDYVKVQVLLSTNSKDEGGHNHAKTIEYHADKIVLALGNDEPSYADWVEDYDVEKGFVRHLLDVDVDADADGNVNHGPDKEKLHRVAIVGGGITAAHKALELSRRYQQEKKDGNAAPSSIHLISRHPLKEQQFDTHQDWMMDRAASKRSEEGGGSGTPKCQVLFQQCDCWKERRKIIAQERIPGTVTPAVHRGEDGLNYAIENGDVEWHQAEIVDKAYAMENGKDEISHLELTLSCGQTIQVDRVLLATGFKKNVPGGSLVRDLVDNSTLNVSDFCGYPIVDENLLWDKKRIYVAGALAELELGPSARNIAGARLAAERIVQAFV